jgi:hypothetical protein
MKLNQIKETIEIIVISAIATTAFTAIANAAKPKIEDYVFLIDRDKDQLAEQYLLRDNQLAELNPLTMEISRTYDKPLENVIHETYRFDILHSHSWTSQGLSLRPDRTAEETKLLMSLTYCELSDYFTGQCPNKAPNK